MFAFFCLLSFVCVACDVSLRDRIVILVFFFFLFAVNLGASVGRSSLLFIDVLFLFDSFFCTLAWSVSSKGCVVLLI